MKKVMDSIKQTQGLKKINNYFSALIKSDSFNNLVNDSRKKYNIPRAGFDNIKKHYGTLTPPKEWKTNSNNDNSLIDDIKNFCQEKKLFYFNLYTDIYDFIIYNKPIEIVDDDLCQLCDIAYRDKMREMFGYLEMDGKSLTEKKFEIPKIDKAENLIYPISIKISPYASIRDIIDFVKKNSKEIKEWQNEYKDENVKIGKIKSKNNKIQERNEFIYNNKNKHLKEIRHILADKNIFLDDGHIAKIISLEKQKRKEV